MNILVLTNKLPYPPRDGGSIATFNMLKGLYDAGNRITCLSLNTSKHPFPVEEIPGPIRAVIRFVAVDWDTSISPVKLLLNLLFSRKPYIAQRFNAGRYREKLAGLLKEEKYDLVQLEGPYTGHYLGEIRKWSDAPVSFRAHNVEHMIWKGKADHEPSLWKRWYLKNMASRLKRFELQVARQSDCLVPISEVDSDFFSREGISHPSITIPAGIEPGTYPPSPLPEDPTIFFIGALDWLPNQEGLTWFLENVFEKVLDEVPRLKFHVAGRNAPYRFVKTLDHEKIEFHGEVDDARAFMRSYRVMVAPLLTGSGIRIKILEAMALGRPVVTSPVGIEGIPAGDNKEVLLADDPYLFSKQLVRVLTGDDEAGRLVNRAREMVTHNFDTFRLSHRLSEFLKAQA